MIHIVFQRADVDVLKKAIELDESLQGEVVLIADDYAVGPLSALHAPEGIESRKEWWRGVLAGGDYEGLVDNGTVPDDNVTVLDVKEKLTNDPQEKLWIWAAQNKHDVSGYYWLMSRLKDFQGKVFILYLNNLPFINEKGLIFYPVNLFDIPAKEFLKARKLARPITLSEFEIDPDEWNKLCQEEKGVRILEGGKKLAQYDYAYFDEELKKFITGDWIKASKLIHQFLSKGKQITGDAYLLWRLKQMITDGSIEAQGELKGMKEFEIKLKGAPALAAAEPIA